MSDPSNRQKRNPSGSPDGAFASSSSVTTLASASHDSISPARSAEPSHDLERGDAGRADTTTSGGDGSPDENGSESEAEPRRRRRKISRLFTKGGKLRPFRLLKQDFHSFRSRWVSDWTVFNQVVLASAVYVFFTNLLPGITFASDLYVLTGKSWGTIEVVFSTGLCGVIFALFSTQPLTILGVTGPFSVLSESVYRLCQNSFHVPFLSVMAWSLIHAGWMHWLLAAFNAHDWTMRYVTHFSTDIFSLLNSVIYFQKAVLELQRNHDAVSFAAFLYSIIGAAGTCLLAVLLSTAESWRPLFGRHVRLALSEYAAAIAIILFVGMPHVGELADLDAQRLMVQTSFRPSDPERSRFFVEFWKIPLPWVFLSIIPGAVITCFFYFDHEISSIICTADRYGTRKPPGFAWDVALLGATTILCGILGIPPANGLLPQAPLHSESLLHTVEGEEDGSDVDGTAASEKKAANGENETSNGGDRDASDMNRTSATDGKRTPAKTKRSRVYEQRFSPFLQGALILMFIAPPFQKLLGLTPTSVLAGLFMFMGYQSLSVNPMLARVGQMLTPPSELPPLPAGVTRLGVYTYTITQVVATGVIFGVTLTVAALCFPVLVILLVPIRLNVLNRIWSRETLRYVDGWACRKGKPEDDK